MVEIGGIALTSAFIAGLLMFLAPCTLPLVPAFLSLISGVSSRDLGREREAGSRGVRRRVFLNGLFFVVGFTLVFVLLGTLVGFLGSSFAGFQRWSRWIGGALILFFGLVMLGVFKIGFLNTGGAFKIPKFAKVGKPSSSFLIGSSFAVGWTPCVGPILAGILTLATVGETAGEGAALLGVFSIGLALPFLGIASTIGSAAERITNLFEFIRRRRVVILGIFGALAGFLLNVVVVALTQMASVGGAGRFFMGQFYILPVVSAVLLAVYARRRESIDVVSVVGGLFLVLLGSLIITNSFNFLVQYVFDLLQFLNYEEVLYRYL